MSALDKVNALRKRLGKSPSGGGNASGKKRAQGGAAGGAAKKQRKAADLQGIDWLLSAPGMNREKFFANHWEKKGVWVKRSNKQYYNDLLPGLGSVEKLWERMERGEVKVNRLNLFRCLDQNTKETPEPPPQTWQEVKKLFEEGWSMQWLQPQHEDDHLARITSILESHFGALVGVNAYLTSPGTQGLAPHYDDVEVFVLQLSGSKQWSLHASTKQSPFSPEAQTLPRYTSTDLQMDLLSPAYLTPKLERGDLLYFPRGTIHYAPSVGDEPSIHLTISTYQRVCNYEVVQKAFEEVMSMLWSEDENLRRGIPLLSTSMGADLSGVGKTVSAALQKAGKVASEHRGDFTDLAMQQVATDFVSCRHPPFIAPPAGTPFVEISAMSKVVLPDPSVITAAELPPDGESDEVVFSLLHCIFNKREMHMLGKAPDEVAEEAKGEDEGEGEEDEEDEEEEEEEEDEENNIIVDAATCQVVKALCKRSPKLPLACSKQAEFDWGAAPTLAQVMKDAGVSASPGSPEFLNICGALSELHSLHIVWAKNV
eukprot:TRINITY_DN21609_c0_g2_i1.p1 TRINITY_DN21609_c0_g2~~TRINITY_DN21609_c0_g2_i1.p1  ORF type:complete len:540 (+),score=247.25 TRINITY_DN21609_c0_g2_i1:183-1802(+)